MPKREAELVRLARALGGAPALGVSEDIEADALAEAFSGMDPKLVLTIWTEWLRDAASTFETDRFVLHMAVARAACRMKRLSSEQAEWLIDMGLRYPCPSYNRYFVQAAVRHLGVRRLLLAYDRLLRQGAVTADEVRSAMYWCFYDPDSIGGARPYRRDRLTALSEWMLRRLLRLRMAGRAG